MIAPPTSPRTRVLKMLLCATAASLLAGCISLFPETEPAQLYRFGVTAPQVPATNPAQPGFSVLLADTGFDRAAAGDRILTVTDTQAAYIKGARWVTSSADLFQSAVLHAFDADRGPARLVARGEIARLDYVLSLDVRTFEVRYSNDRDAAPGIVVDLYAALARTDDQAVSDRNFTVTVSAGDNRVSAITLAFDHAVNKILAELVAWVNAGGGDSAQ